MEKIFNLPRPVLVLLLCQLRVSVTNRSARWGRIAHHVGDSPAQTNRSDGSAAPPGCGSQTHTLDLSHSGISNLTESDIPRRTSCATRLDLSHNRIQEIHDGALAGLPRLKELDLSSNLLHTVIQEPWSGLRALEVLDLRYNLLTGIPPSAFAGLRSLRTVLLQNNSLTAIPQALCRVPSLSVLSLAGNRIISVDAASLQLCTGLRELHLEHNLISRVSPEAFWGMEKLKVLNLSSNLLKTMPTITIQALRERGVAIHLHGNPWGRSCEQGGHCLGLSGMVVSVLHEDTALTLPCRSSSHGEVLYWQTPFGQWKNSSELGDTAPMEILANGSLRIGRSTPHHNGLYYCLHQEGEGQSLHSYRVRYAPARPRKSRETQSYGGVSQRQFGAAVAASVTVTFLAGFSLGAFSRTYLNHCLQKRRAKQAKGNAVHYKRSTFRKGPGASREDSLNIEISSHEDPSPKQTTPPRKAPRTALARQGEDDDSNQETPSLEDSHPEKVVPGDCVLHPGDQEPTGRQRDDSPEEPRKPQPAPRPSKRRVIKLYHYDEDGNPYDHVRDPGGDEGAPLPKQRSLSLTRLNNIMSLAAGPDFSARPPQGDAPSRRESAGATAVFELSA